MIAKYNLQQSITTAEEKYSIIKIERSKNSERQSL